MDVEIEAKFTDISLDHVRTTLKAIGADLVFAERLMKRKVYEHPTAKQNDWFRVRDEGEKITLSYKKLKDRTLHGMQEISFIVPDFDKACRFLEGAHLRFVAYQETKREMWKYGDVEVTIDTWPWITPFVEIESHSEENIKKVAKLLAFDWPSALHGSVENVYTKHYDVTEDEVDDWPEIKFIPVPDWLEGKRR